MIVVLTGGTGGAKLVQGLALILPPEELTIVVNTGDDLVWWGLHVSPDLDTITYALSGRLSIERGWGVDGDSFHCREAMGSLGSPVWFQLGDRDLATHLVRTQLMAAGRTLSQATEYITRGLGIGSRVLPMTDSPVDTRVMTPQGELSFQEYFVRDHFRPEVSGVRFAGAEQACPAPGVIEAIERAAAVVLAPSNPVTSIGPILAVPGIREALLRTRAPAVAVSPLVGNAALSGPTGNLMRSQRLPVSVEGIVRCYDDFLDLLLVDSRDALNAAGNELFNVPLHASDIVMKSESEKVELARQTLLAARAITPRDRTTPKRHEE
jgi:LPPG:FO 2-phospho-L-lactate transferase